jgi:small subunit ribosomal protein S7
MMYEGQRSKSQRIFYAAMENIGKKTNDDPLKTFKKAVENVKPLVEVKTRRVGGANYQVPVEVNQFRRQSLAIRWLLQYSRDRAGKNMVDRLTDELMDAASGKGGAVKKKEDVHRMAEANKAFAHYRW